MTGTTPLQRNISRILGRDLAEYVGEQRSRGLGWRLIAADITERTGLELSRESLRLWFADSESPADRTAA